MCRIPGIISFMIGRITESGIVWVRPTISGWWLPCPAEISASLKGISGIPWIIG